MRKLVSILFLYLVFFPFIGSYASYNPSKEINQAKVVRENMEALENAKGELSNNIQWNFTLLSRGVFALTYERRLNDYFSIEGGLGSTFKDYTSLTTVYNLNDATDNTKYGVGLFLSAASKIYPLKMDDLEGAFVCPIYRLRTYNYTVTYATYSAETFKMNYRASDIAVLAGYQWEGGHNIWWNLYAGYGLIIKSYDGLSYDNTGISHKKISLSETLPSLIIGLTFGLTFY